MKVVILAGGLGSRIAEEAAVRPKPMVEIGGKPILWHIMKSYAAHGFDDFIICLGYKGHVIKEFFANYFLYTSDVTIDLARNSIDVLATKSEAWRVTLVDTGENSMTGGRLKRIRSYLPEHEPFCMTYGDGVSTVDIRALVDFADKAGTLATVTGVRPPGRFGALEVEGDRVQSFLEKPIGDGGWINGGFFVLQPKVLDYVEGDSTTWERQPMERLVREGQLSVYLHDGFWHPIDTLRDKRVLEELWATGAAPWKVWT